MGGLLAGCGSSDDAAIAQGAPTDLSGVTQAWNKNLPAAQRFVTAFPGAVLDRNTGLVWEQAPDITGGPNANGARSWAQAIFSCANKNVGGTVGWRLPSVVELMSVRDPSLPAPFVPASVFTGVQSDFYWSATTYADSPNRAWDVYFLTGGADADLKALNFHVWCVRGGMTADQY